MTTARGPLRIVLIGSECTGKTDLTEWLAAALGVPFSPEFAREHAEAVGSSAALTANDVAPIAVGQRAGEDRAIAAAVAAGAPLVLHDTDLLSTVVYATHYYGAEAVPAWLHAAVAERAPDLYLLCDIDVAWHGDPVRDSTADRQCVRQAFVTALGRQGAPVVAVRGDRVARREVARRTIERVVAAERGG